MPNDLRTLKMPGPWKPVARMGANRAAFYTAETVLASKVKSVMVAGDLWEGGQCFNWIPEAEGELVEFNIPITASGKYRVNFVAALSPE